MAAATSVKLVISSQVKLVDLVHAASEKMAEVAGFDADEALNVGLAVREAVINAIIHGNRQAPDKQVEITLTASKHELTATVRDHGDGFDPDGTPDPTDDPNRLMTSGRGLLLIRAFVDDVEFKQRKQGMELILRKRIKPESKQDE